MASKIKPLVEGAKKVGKQIWPTDKRLAKDIARRTKDIGKKFSEKKDLLAEAKRLGIKNAANVHKRKNGRNQLIELVAKKQKGSARLRDTPVTLGGTARTALDVGLTVPRAVTALGSAGSLSLRGAQMVPATATWLGKGGSVRRFMRGGALVHGALQAGKGGYLALGKGEKADAARREALRAYGTGLDDEAFEMEIEAIKAAVAEGQLESRDAEKIRKELVKANNLFKATQKAEEEAEGKSLGIDRLRWNKQLPANLLRAAEAGFLNPAESTYASVQAKRLMDEQAEDWEKRDLDPMTGEEMRRTGSWNPFSPRSVWAQTGRMKEGTPTPEGEDKRWDYQRPRAQVMADTDGDGIISEEEQAAALEAKPTLGAGWVQRMAEARGAAGRKAYSSKLPPSLRSLASDDLFLGGAGDPEWDKAHRGSIDSRMVSGDMTTPTKKFRDRMYGEEGQYTQYTDQQRQDKEETGAFSKEDRAAFLKAAKDGTLLAAFDVNDDGKLDRKEKKLFFDNEQGFKARRDEIMKAGADLIPAPEPELEMVTDPVTGAEYPAEAGSMPPVDPREAPLGVDPATGDPILPEPEAPEPPPTTREYADMMRQAIDNEAIGIEERNEVMRTIRDEMIDQDLTSFEQFNQIGRQMLEDSGARKAAAHVAYLRSPAGSDWVDTPGLDRLAALQKAPFGRGTALEGSVGKLTDESRQLESRGGRQRRLARELEGKGYRSVAGQVRAGAPRRPLMSQRDRIELEKKKKALAAEQAAAQALISKGEENINANTVS